MNIFDVSKKCKHNKWRTYIKGDSIYLQNMLGEVALIGDVRESTHEMIKDVPYELCIGCEYSKEDTVLCTRPIGVSCQRN